MHQKVVVCKFFCAFSWFIYTNFVFLGKMSWCKIHMCLHLCTNTLIFVFGMIFLCMDTLDKQKCEAMRKPAQTISKTRGKPPTVSGGT